MTNQTILVNNVEIVIATFNNEIHVALKPICTAIGVSYSRQHRKVKTDETFGRFLIKAKNVGADGKKYNMSMLPLRYVFGWLFSISPKNVNPELARMVLKYRMECYDALFENLIQSKSVF